MNLCMDMRKQFVWLLRRKSILRALQNGGKYFALSAQAEMDAYQLKQLNAVWREAVENVPFYRWWKEKHRLPDVISSLEDYDHYGRCLNNAGIAASAVAPQNKAAELVATLRKHFPDVFNES